MTEHIFFQMTVDRNVYWDLTQQLTALLHMDEHYCWSQQDFGCMTTEPLCITSNAKTLSLDGKH